jgi:hypothetical protein
MANHGTNGEPLKRLFSSELPWNAVQTNGEFFSIKIVIDVLPGEQPFLLGFPTLKRILRRSVLMRILLL